LKRDEVYNIHNMKIKENKAEKTFDSKFFKYLLPLLLLMIIFLFFPYLFTRSNWIGINFSGTGQIGETIGGILGPFIAIAAAILTFFAFWVQFKANEQQKIDLQIERFENKFYNLIEIHRNNVSELGIGTKTVGRAVYAFMFKELKYTYLLINDHYNSNYKINFPTEVIPEEIIFNISYFVFFFGIGPNSSKIIIDLIGDKYIKFFQSVEQILNQKITLWQTQKGNSETLRVNYKEEVYELKIHYKPFFGHMSALSYYFRNLFQIAKYIDEQNGNIIPYEKKLQYAGTLRSQLSNHEQLLLYYNSLSVLGKPWIDEGLLQKYCIVKSIPIPLADFYKTPKDWLPEENKFGKTMFEWRDIKNRIHKIQDFPYSSE